MNRIRQEPSPYAAKRFSIIRSVGKQVGLGKLPLATCPAKAPHLDFTAPRGNGYPQVSPRTMDGPPPGPPGLMSSRLLQPATSVIPGFPSSRQAALLRVSLFSAVRCNPPRFEVLPHGGVYCRCRKLCTIGARLRAPELGLGTLSLGGVSRETPRGLPPGVSSRRHPFHSLRLGRVQAPFHRGLMDSIQFSKNVF